jgi:tetratricopeptide (TPR) repeat protein
MIAENLSRLASALIAWRDQRGSFYRLSRSVATGLLAFLVSSCGVGSSSVPPTPALPPAAPLPAEFDASEGSIRFLEDRVKSDPLDFIAYNKLVGYYLQRQRETGNVNYLDLASRAARASLAAIRAEHNVGGLAALAQIEYASHNFAAARDHATQLTELDPAKSYPWQIMGDALLELGDYDRAAAAYQRMEKLGRSVDTETRLARFALLRGQTDIAIRRLTTAIVIAVDLGPPSREAVAWCRWQLGEVAFSMGDYEAAEKHYRDALVTFPNYYRALDSLGRVLAASGDLAGAIGQLEQATRILPDVSFIALLGDLYTLAGRDREAAAQYALIEQVGRLGSLGGALYNRQIALFCADHDLKTDEAYASAKSEYQSRKDIYGADVLAWTALKAGKIDEAQDVIKEALRLGTRDAKLYYHAGMIARATGDRAAARDYLDRALKLSPQFDPLQAGVARKVLEEL